VDWVDIKHSINSGFQEQPLVEELKQENKRLRLIIENAHNGIFAIDSVGKIILFNTAAERLIDLKAEEVLGEKIQEVVPNSGLLRVLETSQSEYGQKVESNGKVYVSNRSPLYDQKKLVGAVAVFQDITELENVSSELKSVKRLNMELDAIIDSSYDGLLVIDEKGNGIRSNASHERISGLAEDYFLNKNIEDFFDRGIFQYQSVTIRALKEKCRVTGIQVFNSGKEVLATASPVFDNDGKVIRVVTNIRDITELNCLREELAKTKALSAKYHSELSKLKEEIKEDNKIIIKNNRVRGIYELAGRVAQSEATVLILGESGVGKEGLAKIMHKKSSRNNTGKFIKINCGAIPENLLESEFFGYEPGSFTGASKDGKKGLFELAHRGTLFLDEVGEMPLSLQVKFLRVLQEQEIYRIGGTSPIKIDVRIVAASNNNLLDKVKKGLFREDLFYRLNVVPLELPPLRERNEDILPLILHFTDIYNKKYKSNKSFSAKTLNIMQSYHWPGNVREIINIIERLIVTSQEKIIDIDQINQEGATIQSKNNSPSIKVNDLMSIKEARQEVEKQLIAKALKKNKSIRSAATALGVSHSTIIQKIALYKLKHEG